VALPEPIPGLVVRYSYLWHRERVEGRSDGRKDRPCAIVVAIRLGEAGRRRALVLPITHSPPHDADLAIELPARVKKRLGLDGAASWVVLSEWNDFVWPGPDLRPVPGRDDGSIAYGVLPPALFAVIRDRFAALVRSRAARPVSRD
jgi:hypothetical protein